jgi:acetyl coenzyme A synthetase (ADP forming)-like protein
VAVCVPDSPLSVTEVDTVGTVTNPEPVTPEVPIVLNDSGPPGRSDWEGDVVLADGATVHMRAMRADDEPRLGQMYERMSSDSVYYRFFSPVPRATATLLELDRLGQAGHAGRVAVSGDDIVAAARYDTVKPGVAEVAFVVADEYQGRGVGTLLLEHLAVIARSHGIHTFAADTLPDNAKMLGMFAAAGWARDCHFDGGTVRTQFSIVPSAESTAAIADREHVAESASMARLLAPRSVAVIGASREPGKIGNAVMQNLVGLGFRGCLYPVNPNATSVVGLPAYASVIDIPDPVDLAIVVRPAQDVLDVVDACAHKQVHALVILSSGFAELGAAGAVLQRSIVARVRANGMRVVGPNCLGIANTAPSVRLNATFAPTAPVVGNVAFLSQSGGLGIELLGQAAARGIGISQFVSVGNKSDVSSNDLLQYWEDDPQTGVILLYLESFGNPRKFARIARRVSRHKPIVVVKSGRTPAGSRAASSHTAALATSDVAVDALFRQAGVIRVDTLEELLDTAQLLATQPVPRGSRVAIIGNAGGPGILAADACAGAGLSVGELSASTRATWRTVVVPGTDVQNPIDLGAAASADLFARALPVVLHDNSVDAVIVVYAPPVVTDAHAVARAVADATATAAAGKPVVACFLGRLDVADDLRGTGESRPTIPTFAFPEAAARALGRAAELAAWRARPRGEMPQLCDVDVGAASALIAARLGHHPDGVWLDGADTDVLLRSFGIPTIEARRVPDVEGALTAAAQIGYPVALKIGSADVVHKTDVGGVKLDLADPDAVQRAFDDMRSRFGAGMHGAMVQRMAPPGLEVIVGVTQDPLFGPLLLFGLGGVTSELLADRALRILPVTDVDAHDLVRSLRTSPLLFGYRGSPALDVAALEDVILRVARLASEAPEITEMDLNPVIVHEHGVVVVDTKVRCAPAPNTVPPELRRMRD